MIVLVTYDLKKAERDYKPFYESLKKQGNWWHYLASTWLLNTQKSPDEIADTLRLLIDSADNLFVTEITSNNAGHLSEKAWDWIKRYEAANS